MASLPLLFLVHHTIFDDDDDDDDVMHPIPVSSPERPLEITSTTITIAILLCVPYLHTNSIINSTQLIEQKLIHFPHLL